MIDRVVDLLRELSTATRPRRHEAPVTAIGLALRLPDEETLCARLELTGDSLTLSPGEDIGDLATRLECSVAHFAMALAFPTGHGTALAADSVLRVGDEQAIPSLPFPFPAELLSALPLISGASLTVYLRVPDWLLGSIDAFITFVNGQFMTCGYGKPLQASARFTMSATLATQFVQGDVAVADLIAAGGTADASIDYLALLQGLLLSEEYRGAWALSPGVARLAVLFGAFSGSKAGANWRAASSHSAMNFLIRESASGQSLLSPDNGDA
jgi:hypothetical protein